MLYRSYSKSLSLPFYKVEYFNLRNGKLNDTLEENKAVLANSWEVNSGFCNRPRGRGYESVDTSHVQWSGDGHVSSAEK